MNLAGRGEIFQVSTQWYKGLEGKNGIKKD